MRLGLLFALIGLLLSLAAFGDLQSFGLRVRVLTPQEAKALGLSGGLVATEVEPGTAGARSGLKPGDVIYQVSGFWVLSEDELNNVLKRHSDKPYLSMRVLREGKPTHLDVNFAPQSQPVATFTPAPLPAPAPPTPPEDEAEDPDAELKYEMVAVIEQQLNRFQGRCFKKVISLGDLSKFAAAIERADVELSPFGLWRNDSMALVEMLDHPEAPVLHLRKSPRELLLETPEEYRNGVRDTLWHESFHLIEHANRDTPLDNPDWEERHTYYYEALLRDFLTSLELLEEAAKNPNVTEQGLRDRWKRAVNFFNAGAGMTNPTYPKPPDIEMFERWSGIRIRLEDVRKLYASGQCGPRLARAVSTEPIAASPTPKPTRPNPPPVASGGSPIGFWKGTWSDNRGGKGAGQLDISWHDPKAGVITVSSGFSMKGRASGSTATWRGEGLGRMRLTVEASFTVNADNRTGNATITVRDAQGNVTIQQWQMTRR